MVRWPLQTFQKAQLQPPVGPSVDSLCHPWFTTTNLSYRFPIFETSATALRGSTGIANDIFSYCKEQTYNTKSDEARVKIPKCMQISHGYCNLAHFWAQFGLAKLMIKVVITIIGSYSSDWWLAIVKFHELFGRCYMLKQVCGYYPDVLERFCDVRAKQTTCGNHFVFTRETCRWSARNHSPLRFISGQFYSLIPYRFVSTVRCRSSWPLHSGDLEWSLGSLVTMTYYLFLDADESPWPDLTMKVSEMMSVQAEKCDVSYVFFFALWNIWAVHPVCEWSGSQLCKNICHMYQRWQHDKNQASKPVQVGHVAIHGSCRRFAKIS